MSLFTLPIQAMLPLNQTVISMSLFIFPTQALQQTVISMSLFTFSIQVLLPLHQTVISVSLFTFPIQARHQTVISMALFTFPAQALQQTVISVSLFTFPIQVLLPTRNCSLCIPLQHRPPDTTSSKNKKSSFQMINRSFLASLQPTLTNCT